MRSTQISRSKVVFALSVLCLVVGLFSISPLFGQEKSGALTGTATDDSGAVLPGVTVTVTNKAMNRAVTTITGADGIYFARPLEPGRYSVKFELPGFSPTEFPDVNVLLGQTAKANVKMKVGSVSTSVEVTETVPLIDTQTTQIAHNVTAEEFDHLPKTRTFQYFAVSAPSVNSGDIEGGIQVNGASSAENNFTVDGITTNSLIYGSSRQNAAFEYLQEVQVKTTGIEAEYGGALGGVISAVTKSGGNDFHGEVHYYYGGNSISAGPVKRLVLDPFDDTRVLYVQDQKNPRSINEVGFSLSGPIMKDKLFYFVSTSPQFIRRTQNYLWTVSSTNRYADADSYTQKQDAMSAFGKLSWDPLSKVRTNFTYLWSPSKSNGAFLAYNGAVPNGDSRTKASNESNKTRGFFQPQANYSGNIDIIASNNILIQSRGTFRWDNYKDTGIPGIPGITYRTSSVGLSGVPTNLQQGEGFTNTSQVALTLFDVTSMASGQVDVGISGEMLGFHNFKAGVGLMKFVNRVNQSRNGGVFIDVYWNRDFTSLVPGVGAGRGTYGYYEVNEIGTIGSTGAGIKNFYFQDQWRITNRLTLNYGLRTEQEKIPSFRRDIKDFAVEFGFADKLAPRLGASYDLFGDGKVKLSGAWGRYYDWTKYELVRGSFGGDTWKIAYRALDTTDVFSLSATNTPGRSLWNPADANARRDRRVPSFDTIAEGLKPMYQDKFNVGFEYEWNPQTVIGARILHDDLKETIEDLGALDAGGNEVYLLANPGIGAGKTAAPATATAPFDWPRPKRQYDALELTATRRFAGGWSGQASYVLSRLYGNYAGLANSDEIRTPTTGRSSATAQQQGGSLARPGSNVSRAWDLDEAVFDSKGHLDLLGRLATDRPHVFKLNGNYEFANPMMHGNTNVGAFFYAGSGTPLSTQVWTRNQIPVYVNARGDRGRTAMLNYTDLVVSHSINVTEGKKLRFEFNMLNAFNQKTTRHTFDYVNRGANSADSASAISLAAVDLKKGYDYNALLNSTTNGRARSLDPRFNMDDLFSAGFAGRFGAKFSW